MKIRWEDAYDIRPSTNSRGENVYDIYRKGTDDMLWADILVEKIDDFLKVMTDYADRVMTQEMESEFCEPNEHQEVSTLKEDKPMEIKYSRLKRYPSVSFEDGQ